MYDAGTMAGEELISVNFGKPVPVFPLAHVALMPQQVLPLHIFEPRYRQLVEHVLDTSGQFAMATFRGPRWKQEYHGSPPIMPAVCLGQISRHEKLHDGRFNLLVQGVCRAKILEEIRPDDETLYRRAVLEPVGVLSSDEARKAEDRLTPLRAHVRASLAEGPLRHLTHAEGILNFSRQHHVPTTVLMELLTVSLVEDAGTRYRLLEEPDPAVRAGILSDELRHFERLIQQAEPQVDEQAPKGCSWN
jgi:hypothetical protein